MTVSLLPMLKECKKNLNWLNIFELWGTTNTAEKCPWYAYNSSDRLIDQLWSFRERNNWQRSVGNIFPIETIRVTRCQVWKSLRVILLPSWPTLYFLSIFSSFTVYVHSFICFVFNHFLLVCLFYGFLIFYSEFCKLLQWFCSLYAAFCI